MFKTSTLTAAVAALAFVCTSNAEIIAVTGITGHDGGNWPGYAGHLTDFVNGSDPSILDPQVSDTPTPGMTLVDAGDPATWTWSSGYTQTWHANSHLSGAANGKLGWVVVDFGSVVSDLDTAYFWGSGQASAGEHVNGINLYYSSGLGIDALPAMPQSKGTTGDYDLTSGDWTFLTAHNLTTDSNGDAGPLDSTADLEGVSARYIAIEVMSMHGTPGNRMAIAQVEFTAVPEPGSLALLGLGGLLIGYRRRRD